MITLQSQAPSLNKLFAGEEFRNDQIASWASALVDAMREDEDLRNQAKVNSEDQFLMSPTLKDSLLIAVAETHNAHSRMTELFNEKGAVEKAMLELLGKLVYRELREDLKPEKNADDK